MNLFTGWVDIPLSEEGIAEAMDAGKALADLLNIQILWPRYNLMPFSPNISLSSEQQRSPCIKNGTSNFNSHFRACIN